MLVQKVVNVLRVLIATFFSQVVFWFAKGIPVFYSDKDIDTIGRTCTYGLPIPWTRVTVEDPIMPTAVYEKCWLLPLNLAFCVVISCFLFRIKTFRGFLACMFLAQLPLVFFLVAYYHFHSA